MEINRWYRSNVSLVIGLYCSEAFTFESVSSIAEDYKVPLSAIENINIKGKVIVRFDSGKEEVLPLKDYQKAHDIFVARLDGALLVNLTPGT